MLKCQKCEAVYEEPVYHYEDDTGYGYYTCPDYYGVQLVKDAKLIIGELHKRQKKHCYLSVRTTHAFRDEVTRELRKEGYTTLQSGVIAVLHEWLEKRKTAAPTAVNQDTMTNNQ